MWSSKTDRLKSVVIAIEQWVAWEGTVQDWQGMPKNFLGCWDSYVLPQGLGQIGVCVYQNPQCSLKVYTLHPIYLSSVLNPTLPKKNNFRNQTTLIKILVLTPKSLTSNYLTSLCFRFLICKVGMIIVLFRIVKIEWVNTWKCFKQCLPGTW